MSYEEVLRLDVPVDDVLCVAVAQSPGEFQDVLRALALPEASLGLEVLIKLAAGAVLENQVNPLVVKEVSVKAKDVDMAKVRLNLNFPAQLVLHSCLKELRFLKDLQGHNIVGRLGCGSGEGGKEKGLIT